MLLTSKYEIKGNSTNFLHKSILKKASTIYKFTSSWVCPEARGDEIVRERGQVAGDGSQAALRNLWIHLIRVT